MAEVIKKEEIKKPVEKKAEESKKEFKPKKYVVVDAISKYGIIYLDEKGCGRLIENCDIKNKENYKVGDKIEI